MNRWLKIADAIEHRHERGDWRMFEYVVMPTHLHLFCEVGGGGMKRALEDFKRWTGHEAGRLLELDGDDIDALLTLGTALPAARVSAESERKRAEDALAAARSAQSEAETARLEAERQAYMVRLFGDTVGFAAAKIIRGGPTAVTSCASAS